MKYVPNALTIIRILVTPLLLVFLFSESLSGRLWALGLFVAASISDYLDGKLARHFMARSRLGQFLDPVADKVLVLGTFVALAVMIPHAVPWWAVGLIAVRDLAVTFLRMWVESRGQTIRTLPVAKLKTTTQLTFLIGVLLLLALERFPGAVGSVAGDIVAGPWLFWLSMLVALVTVYTGIVYFINQEMEPVEVGDE